MKARKSPLAEKLLADPAAREQFRAFMTQRKAPAHSADTKGRQEAISVNTAQGRVLVVPTLLTPKLAG